MPTSQELIHKATVLLDLKQDAVSAQATLLEAVAAASSPVDKVQAKVFLAELLVTLDRAREARTLFESALEDAKEAEEADLVGDEVRRANVFLAKS